MSSREQLYKAIQYIEENLTKSISVEAVCREACYSRFHFQRIFHSATGVTLAEYIQTRRITESARLLLESRDSILQIALTFQFKSHQHYSRLFRTLFKVTPSQFRKKGVADAPKLFEPFTIDDIDLNLDKSGILLGFEEFAQGLIYRKKAGNTSGVAVATLWEEMRECVTDKRSLKGLITYPEQISFDLPYEYSVITEEPVTGLESFSLPAVTVASFRYVGAISNISNMYRFIYCVWMERERYHNPYGFDLEFPTEKFYGPDHYANEFIIQVPILKNSTES